MKISLKKNANYKYDNFRLKLMIMLANLYSNLKDSNKLLQIFLTNNFNNIKAIYYTSRHNINK